MTTSSIDCVIKVEIVDGYTTLVHEGYFFLCSIEIECQYFPVHLLLSTLTRFEVIIDEDWMRKIVLLFVVL